MQNRWAPWLYLSPSLLILGVFLVYPTVNTVLLSLFDRRSENFVGVDNYVSLFSDSVILTALRNNLLWLVVFTAGTVFLGFFFAVVFDRVRYERLAKSMVFLPLAISLVGAGVIWKFVYAFKPPQVEQIGLLNAALVALRDVAADPAWHTVLVVVLVAGAAVSLLLIALALFRRVVLGVPLAASLALAGGAWFVLGQADFVPQGWLLLRPWVNNLALITVGVWIWTGFCMVILSAAYKGIPQAIKEAARIDGANPWQSFWLITIPMMKSTIAVVATTMVINVLKIFDVVFVMTGGQFSTEVIANRMWKEMFVNLNFGRASAIAVILMVAVVPVMLANIRRFREQEAMR